MEWIISANPKYYNHRQSFQDFTYVDWKQVCNFETGDIVYIYSTRPDSKLLFVTEVEKTNLKYLQIRDDKKYWTDLDKYEKSKSGVFARLGLLRDVEQYNVTLDKMKQNGLNNAPQGPVKVRAELSSYLRTALSNPSEVEAKLDLVNEYLEGDEQNVLVTKYERNRQARDECLKSHGYSCVVCDFNFFDKYGKVGKNFIHVHHHIPLSKVKKTYVIDPIRDLVPVCPNCHAMLHRKLSNNKYLSIAELKAMVS
jgi:5-methylcytosine-specific restriction protein A